MWIGMRYTSSKPARSNENRILDAPAGERAERINPRVDLRPIEMGAEGFVFEREDSGAGGVMLRRPVRQDFGTMIHAGGGFHKTERGIACFFHGGISFQ